MKMLLTVELPHEPFNSLVRAGKVGEIIGRILESIHPEVAYFTEQDGMRGGIFLVNVKDPSDVPGFAEPFFLNFQADCKFRIAMSPQDLQKSGLEALGKTWA
ncbi:panthothenate synthetase [Pseudomonas sp. 10C3]|uniref:panthothenate synthetase n=1 Tax=Pseudomonas sp. 10C3 TaxID=3118753 RepID=UPI002E80C23A|nr:panthothenate synthetase [Pseudomonas sp. 10C3]